MRPKIIIVILLAGLVGIAAAFFLKRPVNHPQPSVVPIAQPVAKETNAAAALPKPSPLTNAPIATAPVQPKNPSPVTIGEVVEDNATNVQAQIDRLVDLESNDDAESLQAILKELTNPNKEIRHEAVEATVQFGSRDAIPTLNDLATRTYDPDEKKELLDAAEFLALPTLTEANAQKKLEKAQGGGPQ